MWEPKQKATITWPRTVTKPATKAWNCTRCCGIYFLFTMAYIFFVYLHLLRALFNYFYLKTLQHNTVTHKEQKALVPNTTPPSSLSLAKASILSKALLYIPASQERRALPLQSSEPLEKQFLHSGYLHSQHLFPGNQTLQPLLAEFSLGTVLFFPKFSYSVSWLHSKRDLVSVTKKLCSGVRFKYFLQLCKHKGQLIIAFFCVCPMSRPGMCWNNDW